jgi:thiol-disulfide isomerase/thioredoxin
MTTQAGIALVAGVLLIAVLFGVWERRRRGRIRTTSSEHRLTEAEIGAALGESATLLQFSSAFCTPCRATRTLLSDVAARAEGVIHIDLDAEAHLELVRRLNILTTPTTLILDRDGVEVGRAAGTPRREQVLTALQTIRN